jgi:glycosyltransferase involved in cell wall biosynthesis
LWREQFGFAAVEAMASGLPVRVGDSGSLPEVVGRPGSLIRPHDPLALADALERLAEDPGLRQAEGAENREWAVRRFDQRLIQERLRGLYERVLDEPGA